MRISYRTFSEEKQKKRECGRKRYQNTSQEEKLKLK